MVGGGFYVSADVADSRFFGPKLSVFDPGKAFWVAETQIDWKISRNNQILRSAGVGAIDVNKAWGIPEQGVWLNIVDPGLLANVREGRDHENPRMRLEQEYKASLQLKNTKPKTKPMAPRKIISCQRVYS